MTNSNGLHTFGGATFLNKEERFAEAFADAYQRLYPGDIFVDAYSTAVMLRLGAEQTYMTGVITSLTGAP